MMMTTGRNLSRIPHRFEQIGLMLLNDMPSRFFLYICYIYNIKETRLISDFWVKVWVAR